MAVVCKVSHLRTGRRSRRRPPNSYRSQIVSWVRKIDCACFCHISTSGFPEIGYCWHCGEKSKARLFRLTRAFCSTLQASPFGHQTPKKPKFGARPFGPRHSPLSVPFYEITTQMSARPFGLAFRASQIPRSPLFRPYDVCLAVLDVLCSTPTTKSVNEYCTLTLFLWFYTH